MMSDETLLENWNRIRGSIPGGVTLVAASKTVPAEILREAVGYGITILGENRVQELLEKFPAVPGARWHMIGHLQTNKVKSIIDKVELIHSVDSVKLAAEIDRQAERIGKVQEILLEINLGSELSKCGFALQEVNAALAEIEKFQHVRTVGVMGMVPKTDCAEENAPYYDAIREKFDELKAGGAAFRYLSVGMSNDYLPAIAHGSNMVRLGTALFGKRDYPGRN